MGGIKIFGRILSFVLTAVLSVLLLCNVYIIAARAFTGNPQPSVLGYSTAVVVSGSMSGSIEIDDLVLIHQEESYAVGDVITFESGSSMVTHRIVDTCAEGFVTKGDANNAADSDPVQPEQIRGRVVRVVPGVGRFLFALRTPLGMTCLVLVGLLMLELPTMAEYLISKTSGGRYHGKHLKK